MAHRAIQAAFRACVCREKPLLDLRPDFVVPCAAMAEVVANRRAVLLTVIVAALGYFVDIYDLVLFIVIRKKSLLGVGVPVADLAVVGGQLISAQMYGMLVGGIAWGVLGDRRGRLSVLFGSILTYSLANIVNAYVTSVGQYELVRFIAGFGLAGELGAGITLVSEVMHREARGYGTTLVAAVGICGAVVAALVGDRFTWQTAYIVGGCLGLALLLLRVGLSESGMFASSRRAEVSHGNFFALFSSWTRLRRYGALILVGLPIWYVVGILVAFSPELSKAMGLPEASAAMAIAVSYSGLALGDLASGALSQILKSRKKVLWLFVAGTALGVVAYLTVGRGSLFALYGCMAVLGFFAGYWAVFVTVASEQFGTNLRATATTTAPNFVRGAVPLLVAAFMWLKTLPSLGSPGAAAVVGAVTLVVAALCLATLDDTYGRDLDFVER